MRPRIRSASLTRPSRRKRPLRRPPRRRTLAPGLTQEEHRHLAEQIARIRTEVWRLAESLARAYRPAAPCCRTGALIHRALGGLALRLQLRAEEEGHPAGLYVAALRHVDEETLSADPLRDTRP